MHLITIDASDLQRTRQRFINTYSSKQNTFTVGHSLKMKASQGSGIISFYEFNDGLSLILLDCNFREGLRLEVDTSKFNPLYPFLPNEPAN